MKRFHRLPLAVATALCAIAVAAPALAQTSGTLKKIQDTGTITIGHRESSIPFSYLDDKQQPIGYAMDLCAKVVDAVKAQLKLPNLKVAYQPVNSANRITLLQNGKIGWRRFLFEHVESCAGDLPGSHRGLECFGVDEFTASAVDDAHAVLHRLERLCADHAVRFRRERHVVGNFARRQQVLVE